jgi:hypothetical protein
MCAMSGSGGSRPQAPGTGLRLSSVWVVAAFALPVTIVLVAPLDTIDLAYVIRAGRVMLRTGDVLRTDAFLFTTRCEPWANQQWGAEVLLAGVFDALGWLGLAIVRAGLAAAIVAFVYAACRDHGAERRAAGWLTLLAGVLLLGGLQLRAQLLGLACFAALLWILARRKDNPNGVFWAIPLLALWANVHGSFPFGIVLLVAAWLEDRAASRPGGRTLVAAVLSLGATALTPFGPSVWRYVIEVSTNPVIRTVVEEWRPPSFASYSGAIFFLSVALAVVVLWRNRRSLPWPTALQLAGFLFLAASSTRAVFWWALLLPITLARIPWARRPAAADPRNRVNWALAGVFAAIPVFAIFRWLPYPDADPPPNLLTRAPLALTSELRTILQPREAFANPQAWGSWFELSLPNHLVYVDSRFELMPVESLRANHRIANAEPGWERDLDALPVRVLVVEREREPRLVEALASSVVWREVYADDDGVIYVRADRPPSAPPACPVPAR